MQGEFQHNLKLCRKGKEQKPNNEKKKKKKDFLKHRSLKHEGWMKLIIILRMQYILLWKKLRGKENKVLLSTCTLWAKVTHFKGELPEGRFLRGTVLRLKETLKENNQHS